jgi:hypothetical protein
MRCSISPRVLLFLLLAVALLASGCKRDKRSLETELLGKTANEVIDILGPPAEDASLNPTMPPSARDSEQGWLRWQQESPRRELHFPDEGCVVVFNEYGRAIAVRKK